MLVLTRSQGLYWLGLCTREHVGIDWVLGIMLVLTGCQELRILAWAGH